MADENVQPCCVCGAPARYGGATPVCGPGCDRVTGTPEDVTALIVALVVLLAIVAVFVWAALS